MRTIRFLTGGPLDGHEVESDRQRVVRVRHNHAFEMVEDVYDWREDIARYQFSGTHPIGNASDVPCTTTDDYGLEEDCD